LLTVLIVLTVLLTVDSRRSVSEIEIGVDASVVEEVVALEITVPLKAYGYVVYF
jgi:hypothetical protein